VPGCGAAVHSGTVGMVRSTGVPFGGGVVVMGTLGVTTLQSRGPGELELPLHPRMCHPHQRNPRAWYAEMVTRCAPFLQIRAPESFPSGERLWLPKRSVVNSKLPNQMVSPEVNPMSDRFLSWATRVSFGE
jgi:hypothetical protein